VDGEKTNYSVACGMSASAEWAIAQKKVQRGPETSVKSLQWMDQKNIISSGELLSINYSFCGGYSELPKANHPARVASDLAPSSQGALMKETEKEIYVS